MERREARRLQLWSVLVTALATIVVAIIGLFGTLSATGRAITSDATAPQPTVTVTRTVAAPPPALGSTTGSTNSPAAAGGTTPKVRQTAALRVDNSSRTNTTGTTADLDATDKQWGAAGSSGDGKTEGPGYPSYTGDILEIDAPYALIDPGTNVEYQTCVDAPGYQEGYTTVAIGDLAAGRVICVRTTANRYARLTVKHEATPSRIDFDVTVWQRAGA